MISSVSLIIPTFNEGKYLPRLLQSLVHQTSYPAHWEIIIVDGQSTDQTCQEAKKFKKYFKELIILHSPKGIGIQRNLGAQKAKYPYLFFVDADMRFPCEFFARFLAKVPSNRKDILITTVILPDSKEILDYLIQCIGYLISIYIYFFDPFTTGGLTFTTKKLHNQIGGFNKKIVLGEDVEYGRRLRHVGAKFIFFFSLYTFHSPRRMYKLGRLKFMYTWMKAYWYSLQHRYIVNTTMIDYRYGEYQ